MGYPDVLHDEKEAVRSLAEVFLQIRTPLSYGRHE